MVTKNLMLVVLVFLTALFVIVVYYFLPLEIPSITQISIGKREITPPPATGNVNDLLNALIKELSDEGLTLSEEEDDAKLINTDSREISDFLGSINEKEL